MNNLIAKQKIASADWGMRLAADPFKGQRSLSLRNDFNLQWPETTRIATLSQQMALIRNNPPPCLDRAGGVTSDIAAQN
jgi:hypothetical protein